MSIQLEQQQLRPTQDDVIPATESIGVQTLVSCPNCEAKAILFSRTIQTFCFVCGEAVTQFDSAGMYYVAINRASNGQTVS